MDFSLTEPQRQRYDRVLEFARRELDDDVAERDRAQRFAREAWRRCGAEGLLGLHVPRAYGGLGLDCLSTALALEALGRGCRDAGLGFSIGAHLFAAATPIAAFGDEALKARLLPRMCDGALVGANAMTEPEAGSDALALKCRAVRDGDGYVLDGEKSYVTNGPVADVFVVYASTEPAHGFLGVSAFVVERGAPGLEVADGFEKIGLRTAPTGALRLSGCRVPAGARLGAEGQGGEVFRRSMLWERSCAFAVYVGAMQRQLDETVEFARTRRQGRRPIGAHQAVSHRVVDMALRLDAARLLLYRACWRVDVDVDAEKEVAMAKVAVSEAAVQSALDAVQVHGGRGVLAAHGVERALRDAVPATITAGTSEIQRNLIAKGLGL